MRTRATTTRARLVATLGISLLVFAACGGGATPQAETTSPSPTVTPTDTTTPTAGQSTTPTTNAIEIIDNEYRPAETTVPSGTTVVWTHMGTAAHSVTAKDGSFDSSPQCGSDISQCMKPGQTFPHQFNTPGRFEYSCRIHGDLMTGVVVVT